MIKWNEVTWYSKLGAVILFVAVLPALSFYIGSRVQEEKDKTIIIRLLDRIAAERISARNQYLSLPPVKERVNSIYVPTPIKFSPVPPQYGGFKDTPSPNDQFVARSYSSEQGDTAIYITNKGGERVTQTYCGSFNEWDKNSTKVKVIVSANCDGATDYLYFFLKTDGTLEAIPFN